MGISGFIFGIASAGATALGFFATSVVAFLAPPGVIETRPKSNARTDSNPIKSHVSEDAPRLRLVSRTSRNRNFTRAIPNVVTAAPPRMATAVQMRRVTTIVEDATVRSISLRQLQERTRTQIDAAEHALISLRNELAAIMPAARPEFRAAA